MRPRLVAVDNRPARTPHGKRNSETGCERSLNEHHGFPSRANGQPIRHKFIPCVQELAPRERCPEKSRHPSARGCAARNFGREKPIQRSTYHEPPGRLTRQLHKIPDESRFRISMAGTGRAAPALKTRFTPCLGRKAGKLPGARPLTPTLSPATRGRGGPEKPVAARDPCGGRKDGPLSRREKDRVRGWEHGFFQLVRPSPP